MFKGQPCEHFRGPFLRKIPWVPLVSNKHFMSSERGGTFMISSWGSFGEVGQGVLPHRWLQRHRAPVQSLRLRSLLRSAERAYLVEREFKEDPAFGRGPRLENPSPPQPQTDSLFAFAHRSRGVFKFRRTPQAGTARFCLFMRDELQARQPGDLHISPFSWQGKCFVLCLMSGLTVGACS